MSETDTFVVVDLFAGAGGLSEALVEAIIEHNRETIAADTGLHPDEVERGHSRVNVWLAEYVELHAVNHWEPAITTHEDNHPWAEHYHSRIQEVYPPDIAEPGEVDLLMGGPECTHFSNARGGKPVSDQKRASAWHVLDWIDKLQPEHILIENVKEFRSWGPTKDGTPTKDGSIFEPWVVILERFGYSVVYDDEAEEYGVTLNAADYGDPQSRERLFILASRSKLPTAPAPTHSDDPDDDLPPRRTAADIIDWSDLGSSIWTRDLENARVTPLAKSTMARIAEGIRRHCDDRLAPFADVLETIDEDRLRELRERVIPARYAPLVADALDEPFLVRTPAVAAALATSGAYVLGQHSNSVARDVHERPAPTVASGGKLQVCTPESFFLRQQSGGVPVPPSDPLSTVAGGGAIGMTTVKSWRLLQPKNGVYGEDDIAYDPFKRQHHTVITDSRQGHLMTPSLVRYSHGGRALPVDDPMPTVATEKGGTFALTSPYLCPLYNERPGQRPRTRAIDRPMMTVPAKKSTGPAGVARPYLCPMYNTFSEGESPRTRTVDRPLMTVTAKKPAPSCLATPFLVEYYGNSDASSVDAPVPTVTKRDRFGVSTPFLVDYMGESTASDVESPVGTIKTRDRYALCIPEEWPWGLDVRYRMLRPEELKQAQGFPEDYEITASRKEDRTAQIGNAVPVNLARALIRHLLADETPSLTNFGGGISPDQDVDVPDYDEVSSDD